MTAQPRKPEVPRVLTVAQQRIYDEVIAAGRRVYNGRARRSIEALEAAGLVKVEWEMQPELVGSGCRYSWQIVVEPR